MIKTEKKEFIVVLLGFAFIYLAIATISATITLILYPYGALVFYGALYGAMTSEILIILILILYEYLPLKRYFARLTSKNTPKEEKIEEKTSVVVLKKAKKPQETEKTQKQNE